MNKKRSATQDEAKNKISSFQIYWECQIDTLLKNSKLIKEHPDWKRSTSSVLSEFARCYYRSSIDSALLAISQTIDLIDIVSPGIKKSIHKNKSNDCCLQRVLSYRNNFLVHKEENCFSYEWMEISKKISNGKIDFLSEITCAYHRVLKIIESLGVEASGSATEGYKFSEDEVSALISSVSRKSDI